MQIFVKTLVGKPVLLDVQPSDTIEVLRQKIEEKVGFYYLLELNLYFQIGAAAEFQLLTFNGRYLTTDLTAKLSDFGIVKNSTIQLTVRCSGGDWF
jgi:ubiquitin C